MSSYWIETYSGIKFDLENPRPEMVEIVDIAVALSNLCRFNGHTHRFYSVAEHSVLVSKLVESMTETSGERPDLLIAALLHDAHEAYTGDVTRPIKALLAHRYTVNGEPDPYDELCYNIQSCIHTRFDIPFKQHPFIKDCDRRILINERNELMPDELPRRHAWEEDLDRLKPFPFAVVRSWTPGRARDAFIRRFTRLTTRGE